MLCLWSRCRLVTQSLTTCVDFSNSRYCWVLVPCLLILGGSPGIVGVKYALLLGVGLLPLLLVCTVLCSRHLGARHCHEISRSGHGRYTDNWMRNLRGSNISNALIFNRNPALVIFRFPLLSVHGGVKPFKTSWCLRRCPPVLRLTISLATDTP